MNTRLEKYNGKAIGRGRIRMVQKFSINEFLETLIVSFRLIPLVLGGIDCGRRKRV